MSKKVIFTLLLFFAIVMLFIQCTKKPPDEPVFNQPPETFLANVPPDSSYIYHARLIFWYGTDEDGIVVRYDWAIDDTVYNPNIAGSGWHSLYMDSTLATQDTIAFEAPLPDTIYSHTFYVRAVDNDNLPDPTPARRIFNTSNIPPNTRFVSIPVDSTQRFILQDATDLWQGINFEWTAVDSDMVFPAQFQFLWGKNHIVPDSIPSMNDPRWSTPVEEQSHYFTGQNAPYEEGYHTVYVRAMDDAGSVDPSLSDTTIFIAEIDTTVTPHDTTWDTLVYNQWVTLYFVIPEIYRNPNHRKLLWMNFAENAQVNMQIINPFFNTILGDSLNLTFDTLDYSQALIDSIDHKLLGQYSTILWSKDDATPWDDYPLTKKQGLLSDFMSVGGRVIFDGSKVLSMSSAFAPNISFALSNLFPYYELHIEQYVNFAIGKFGVDTAVSPVPTDTAFYTQDETLYPHLAIENTSVSWNNTQWWYFTTNNFLIDALELDLWGEYPGELQIIYTINHHRDNALYERVPAGIRYQFDVNTYPTFFYFGFPLAYFTHADAAALLRQVLVTELGE